MATTDMEARNAKAKDKPYKIFYGDGLFLQVATNGAKYWRMKYRIAGKEKLLALGVYPEVPLKGEYLEKGNPDSWIDGARDLCATARKRIAAGVDPGDVKKVQRQVAKLSKGERPEDCFEIVAREWHNKFKSSWSENHANVTLRRLERDIFPWLGKRPIGELEPLEILTVLQRIESRGANETARRLKILCGQIFRYAVATGRAKRDQTADLKGALAPPVTKNMAALTDPKDVALLLQASDEYQGSFVVKCALKLAALFFCRPGELRHTEWAEINFETAQLNIPIERMKLPTVTKRKCKGQLHLIPLSRQAIAILKELQPLTGHSKYV